MTTEQPERQDVRQESVEVSGAGYTRAGDPFGRGVAGVEVAHAAALPTPVATPGGSQEDAVLDAIDELVDEQMAGGEPETGYDFNDPTYPKCPNPWCHEDWHGLRITQRMQQMRWFREVDPAYDYKTDESPVLCPGSDHKVAWPDLPMAAGSISWTLPPLWYIDDWTPAQPQWWRCVQGTVLLEQVETVTVRTFTSSEPWRGSSQSPPRIRLAYPDPVTGGAVGGWSEFQPLHDTVTDACLRYSMVDGVMFVDVYHHTPPSVGTWWPVPPVTEEHERPTTRRERRGSPHRSVPMWVNDFARRGRRARR